LTAIVPGIQEGTSGKAVAAERAIIVYKPVLGLNPKRVHTTPAAQRGPVPRAAREHAAWAITDKIDTEECKIRVMK